MMYDYECTECKAVFDIRKSISEASRNEYCPKCYHKAKRIYNSSINTADGFKKFENAKKLAMKD